MKVKKELGKVTEQIYNKFTPREKEVCKLYCTGDEYDKNEANRLK
jgi:hypothetical protein